MTDTQLGPTAQKVLELLRQQRGTPYSAESVCEEIDCATSQAQVALDSLAHAGLLERQESISGTVTFVAR